MNLSIPGVGIGMPASSQAHSLLALPTSHGHSSTTPSRPSSAARNTELPPSTSPSPSASPSATRPPSSDSHNRTVIPLSEFLHMDLTRPNSSNSQQPSGRKVLKPSRRNSAGTRAPSPLPPLNNDSVVDESLPFHSENETRQSVEFSIISSDANMMTIHDGEAHTDEALQIQLLTTLTAQPISSTFSPQLSTPYSPTSISRPEESAEEIERRQQRETEKAAATHQRKVTAFRLDAIALKPKMESANERQKYILSTEERIELEKKARQLAEAMAEREALAEERRRARELARAAQQTTRDLEAQDLFRWQEEQKALEESYDAASDSFAEKASRNRAEHQRRLLRLAAMDAKAKADQERAEAEEAEERKNEEYARQKMQLFHATLAGDLDGGEFLKFEVENDDNETLEEAELKQKKTKKKKKVPNKRPSESAIPEVPNESATSKQGSAARKRAENATISVDFATAALAAMSSLQPDSSPPSSVNDNPVEHSNLPESTESAPSESSASKSRNGSASKPTTISLQIQVESANNSPAASFAPTPESETGLLLESIDEPPPESADAVVDTPEGDDPSNLTELQRTRPNKKFLSPAIVEIRNSLLHDKRIVDCLRKLWDACQPQTADGLDKEEFITFHVNMWRSLTKFPHPKPIPPSSAGATYYQHPCIKFAVLDWHRRCSVRDYIPLTDAKGNPMTVDANRPTHVSIIPSIPPNLLDSPMNHVRSTSISASPIGSPAVGLGKGRTNFDLLCVKQKDFYSFVFENVDSCIMTCDVSDYTDVLKQVLRCISKPDISKKKAAAAAIELDVIPRCLLPYSQVVSVLVATPLQLPDFMREDEEGVELETREDVDAKREAEKEARLKASKKKQKKGATKKSFDGTPNPIAVASSHALGVDIDQDAEMLAYLSSIQSDDLSEVEQRLREELFLARVCKNGELLMPEFLMLRSTLPEAHSRKKFLALKWAMLTLLLCEYQRLSYKRAKLGIGPNGSIIGGVNSLLIVSSEKKQAESTLNSEASTISVSSNQPFLLTQLRQHASRTMVETSKKPQDFASSLADTRWNHLDKHWKRIYAAIEASNQLALLFSFTKAIRMFGEKPPPDLDATILAEDADISDDEISEDDQSAKDDKLADLRKMNYDASDEEYIPSTDSDLSSDFYTGTESESSEESSEEEEEEEESSSDEKQTRKKKRVKKEKKKKEPKAASEKPKRPKKKMKKRGPKEIKDDLPSSPIFSPKKKKKLKSPKSKSKRSTFSPSNALRPVVADAAAIPDSSSSSEEDQGYRPPNQDVKVYTAAERRAIQESQRQARLAAISNNMGMMDLLMAKKKTSEETNPSASTGDETSDAFTASDAAELERLMKDISVDQQALDEQNRQLNQEMEDSDNRKNSELNAAATSEELQSSSTAKPPGLHVVVDEIDSDLTILTRESAAYAKSRLANSDARQREEMKRRRAKHLKQQATKASYAIDISTLTPRTALTAVETNGFVEQQGNFAVVTLATDLSKVIATDSKRPAMVELQAGAHNAVARALLDALSDSGIDLSTEGEQLFQLMNLKEDTRGARSATQSRQRARTSSGKAVPKFLHSTFDASNYQELFATLGQQPQGLAQIVKLLLEGRAHSKKEILALLTKPEGGNMSEDAAKKLLKRVKRSLALGWKAEKKGAKKSSSSLSGVTVLDTLIAMVKHKTQLPVQSDTPTNQDPSQDADTAADSIAPNSVDVWDKVIKQVLNQTSMTGAVALLAHLKANGISVKPMLGNLLIDKAVVKSLHVQQRVEKTAFGVRIHRKQQKLQRKRERAAKRSAGELVTDSDSDSLSESSDDEELLAAMDADETESEVEDVKRSDKSKAAGRRKRKLKVKKLGPQSGDESHAGEETIDSDASDSSVSSSLSSSSSVSRSRPNHRRGIPRASSGHEESEAEAASSSSFATPKYGIKKSLKQQVGVDTPPHADRSPMMRAKISKDPRQRILNEAPRSVKSQPSSPLNRAISTKSNALSTSTASSPKSPLTKQPLKKFSNTSAGGNSPLRTPSQLQIQASINGNGTQSQQLEQDDTLETGKTQQLHPSEMLSLDEQRSDRNILSSSLLTPSEEHFESVSDLPVTSEDISKENNDSCPALEEQSVVAVAALKENSSAFAEDEISAVEEQACVDIDASHNIASLNSEAATYTLSSIANTTLQPSLDELVELGLTELTSDFRFANVKSDAPIPDASANLATVSQTMKSTTTTSSANVAASPIRSRPSSNNRLQASTPSSPDDSDSGLSVVGSRASRTPVRSHSGTNSRHLTPAHSAGYHRSSRSISSNATSISISIHHSPQSSVDMRVDEVAALTRSTDSLQMIQRPRSESASEWDSVVASPDIGATPLIQSRPPSNHHHLRAHSGELRHSPTTQSRNASPMASVRHQSASPGAVQPIHKVRPRSAGSHLEEERAAMAAIERAKQKLREAVASEIARAAIEEKILGVAKSREAAAARREKLKARAMNLSAAERHVQTQVTRIIVDAVSGKRSIAIPRQSSQVSSSNHFFGDDTSNLTVLPKGAVYDVYSEEGHIGIGMVCEIVTAGDDEVMENSGFVSHRRDTRLSHSHYPHASQHAASAMIAARSQVLNQYVSMSPTSIPSSNLRMMVSRILRETDGVGGVRKHVFVEVNDIWGLQQYRNAPIDKKNEIIDWSKVMEDEMLKQEALSNQDSIAANANALQSAFDSLAALESNQVPDEDNTFLTLQSTSNVPPTQDTSQPIVDHPILTDAASPRAMLAGSTLVDAFQKITDASGTPFQLHGRPSTLRYSPSLELLHPNLSHGRTVESEQKLERRVKAELVSIRAPMQSKTPANVSKSKSRRKRSDLSSYNDLTSSHLPEWLDEKLMRRDFGSEETVAFTQDAPLLSKANPIVVESNTPLMTVTRGPASDSVSSTTLSHAAPAPVAVLPNSTIVHAAIPVSLPASASLVSSGPSNWQGLNWFSDRPSAGSKRSKLTSPLSGSNISLVASVSNRISLPELRSPQRSETIRLKDSSASSFDGTLPRKFPPVQKTTASEISQHSQVMLKPFLHQELEGRIENNMDSAAFLTSVLDEQKEEESAESVVTVNDSTPLPAGARLRAHSGISGGKYGSPARKFAPNRQPVSLPNSQLQSNTSYPEIVAQSRRQLQSLLSPTTTKQHSDRAQVRSMTKSASTPLIVASGNKFISAVLPGFRSVLTTKKSLTNLADASK